MKKLLIFALVLALLLSACSSTKFPMTEQHEKFGRKALEIADAYLDFDLTVDEAYKKIDDLYVAADSLPEGTKEQETGNSLVTTKVFLLQTAFYGARTKSLGLATAVSSDVLEARNNLAELLGVKAR